MFAQAELVAMLRDTGGVPVEHGASSTWARHEVSDEPTFGPQGEVILGQESLVIATGTLPGLEVDEILLVAGEERAVQTPPVRIDGGMWTRIVIGDP